MNKTLVVLASLFWASLAFGQGIVVTAATPTAEFGDLAWSKTANFYVIPFKLKNANDVENVRILVDGREHAFIQSEETKGNVLQKSEWQYDLLQIEGAGSHAVSTQILMKNGVLNEQVRSYSVPQCLDPIVKNPVTAPEIGSEDTRCLEPRVKKPTITLEIGVFPGHSLPLLRATVDSNGRAGFFTPHATSVAVCCNPRRVLVDSILGPHFIVKPIKGPQTFTWSGGFWPQEGKYPSKWGEERYVLIASVFLENDSGWYDYYEASISYVAQLVGSPW